MIESLAVSHGRFLLRCLHHDALLGCVLFKSASVSLWVSHCGPDRPPFLCAVPVSRRQAAAKLIKISGCTCAWGGVKWGGPTGWWNGNEWVPPMLSASCPPFGHGANERWSAGWRLFASSQTMKWLSDGSISSMNDDGTFRDWVPGGRSVVFACAILLHLRSAFDSDGWPARLRLSSVVRLWQVSRDSLSHSLPQQLITIWKGARG